MIEHQFSSSIEHPLPRVVAEQRFEVFARDMPDHLSQCLEDQDGILLSMQRAYLPANLHSILYVQAQVDQDDQLTFLEATATDSKDNHHLIKPIDQATYLRWASLPDVELVEFERTIIGWDDQTVLYDTYGDNSSAETTVTVQLSVDNPTLQTWLAEPSRAGWLNRPTELEDLPRESYYSAPNQYSPAVGQELAIPDLGQEPALSGAA